jgi:hypothetical protein
MTTINKECLSKLADVDAIKLGFAMALVTVREYKRVKGTAADVADWDAKCAEVAAVMQKGDKDAIIAAMNKNSPDAASKEFNKAILEGTQGMKAPLPGWNDATCSMDWKEWACFCNNAAKLNWTADFLSGFSKLSYDRDPVVMSDPAYACAQPPCGGAAPAKGFFTGWVPWAIGGVAAVGIGTAAVLYYKRKM